MVLERERDGFMGLRERKRGREIWGCDCGQPWETVKKFFEINWILIVCG